MGQQPGRIHQTTRKVLAYLGVSAADGPARLGARDSGRRPSPSKACSVTSPPTSFETTAEVSPNEHIG